MFLLGTALGVIRAALFPILFIGCTALKFLVWLFRDVGYNLMWEGELQLVGNRFLEIGRCAPVMWDAVGFDSTRGAGHAVGQIVIQPAQFASKVTGVHHFYKSERDLCQDVQCGRFASCTAGQCYCDMGYYPMDGKSSDCGLATTAAGCVCQSVWSSGRLITQNHFGCPSSKFKCKVDTAHPTFASCKANIKNKRGKKLFNQIEGMAKDFLFGKKAPTDRCTPPKVRAKVPPMLTK